MARSRGEAVAEQELSTEDQAAFEAMQADDITPVQNDGGQQSAPDVNTTDADAAAPQDGDTGDGAPAPQRQPTMVPHSALHAEREEHKRTRAALEESQRLQRVVEERTNLILQRFVQPQQAPQAQPTAAETIPDATADPAGHILGVLRRQDAQIAQMTQALQQRGQVDQSAQAISMLQRQAIAAEGDFVATTPDYPQAVQHLRTLRSQQLDDLGYSPVEKAQMIETEALGIAGRALQMGKNPAAVIYALAQHSGYRATPTNGADNTPVDASARIAQVAAGQQQARGIGSARGAGPAPLTAQRLAEMSYEEFDKAMKTPEGLSLMG